MKKSTIGVKTTWCVIIGIVVGLIVGFLVWGSAVSGEREEIAGQNVAVYDCSGLIQVLVFNSKKPERIMTIGNIHQARFFSEETIFNQAILNLEASNCTPVVTRLIREDPTGI